MNPHAIALGAFLGLASLPVGSARPALAMGFTALAALLGLVLLRADHVDRLRRRGFWLPLALLLADIGYQVFSIAFVSISAEDSLRLLLRSCACLCVLLMTLTLPDGRAVRQAGMIVVAVALFQSVYGTLMTLSGTEWSFFFPKEHYLGVATGTFVNRNHFAGWLALALMIGVGLMLSEMSGDDGRPASWRTRLRDFLAAVLSRKGPLRIALVIIVIGIIMSRSRMGNTATFAALNVGFVAIFLLQRRVSASLGLLFGSLLLVDLILAGTFFGVGEVADRLQQTNAMAENRDEVNWLVLDLIRDHLWFGTGAGTFYTAFPAYRDATITAFYDHAHNDYLQLLAERGVLGVIPPLSLLLLSLWRAVQALRLHSSALARGLAFAAVAGIAYTLLHATVDFNLQIPANTWLFMFVLGLGWLAPVLREQGTHAGRKHRRHRNTDGQAFEPPQPKTSRTT